MSRLAVKKKQEQAVQPVLQHSFLSKSRDEGVSFPSQPEYCPCDGCCPRCVSVQAKLKVNAPGDCYEKEADQVASRIVKMGPANNPNHVGMSEMSQQDRTSTMKIKRETSVLSSVSPKPTQHTLSKGNGTPLSDEQRNYFEPRFGYDFGHVRLHADNQAAKQADSIGANAFTYGQDIFFNQNNYDPHSTTGKQLLAHELTHVVQQNPIGSNSLVRQSHPGQIQRDDNCDDAELSRVRRLLRTLNNRLFDSIRERGMGQTSMDPEMQELLRAINQLEAALEEYEDVCTDGSTADDMAVAAGGAWVVTGVPSGGEPIELPVAVIISIAAGIAWIFSRPATQQEIARAARALARAVERAEEVMLRRTLPDTAPVPGTRPVPPPPPVTVPGPTRPPQPIRPPQPRSGPRPTQRPTPETGPQLGPDIIPPVPIPRRPPRRRPECGPLPVSWPLELPIPEGALIRVGSAERDWENLAPRGREQRHLAEQIRTARTSLNEAERADAERYVTDNSCFGYDQYERFDAHHIQPLYLAGQDFRDNLCALETDRHMLGHRRLDNQTEWMEQYAGCGIVSANLSRHPDYTEYFIADFK